MRAELWINRSARRPAHSDDGLALRPARAYPLKRDYGTYTFPLLNKLLSSFGPLSNHVWV